MVPFGQLVVASCSTNTCAPLIAPLLQQLWMTPDESIGLAAIAAAAAASRSPRIPGSLVSRQALPRTGVATG